MKILAPVFSTPHPESGGMARITSLAERCFRDGHEIVFMASGFQSRVLRQKGFRVIPLPEPTFFGLPGWMSRIIERQMHSMSLPVPMTGIWFLYAFAGNAAAPFLRAAVKSGLELIDSYKPDAILTDYSPVAFTLRALTGLPLACTYSAVYREDKGSFFYDVSYRSLNKVLALHGMKCSDIDDLFFGPGVFKIVPNIPELDDADSKSADVYYSGSLFDPAKRTNSPLKAHSGKRYVFVYVGTGSVTTRELHTVLPHVFPEKGACTCIVGAPGVEQAYSIGGVEFHPFVPIAEILPHCDWTICHGGQNTITESLMHGVPLIIFPGNIWERRYNAKKVQESGAGIMAERRDFCSSWLLDTMEKRASYRPDAVRLSETLRSSGGLEGAYRQLLRFYSKHEGLK